MISVVRVRPELGDHAGDVREAGVLDGFATSRPSTRAAHSANPALMPRKLSPRGLTLVISAMLSVFTGTLGSHSEFHFHARGVLPDRYEPSRSRPIGGPPGIANFRARA